MSKFVKICRMRVIKISIFFLFLILSTCIVGCGCNDNKFFPEIKANVSVIEIVEGDEINIEDIYETNIDVNLLDLRIDNLDIVHIENNKLYAIKEGVTTLYFQYVYDNNISINIQINVSKKIVYATEILVNDNFVLNVGDVLEIKDIYTINPITYNGTVSYNLIGDACMVVEGTVVAVKEGDTQILIVAQKSKDEFIQKVINIDVVKGLQTINISARVVDKSNNVVEQIFDNTSNYIIIETISGLNLKDFKFSDSITILECNNDGGKYVFEVTIDKANKYVITYLDDKYYGEYEIICSFDFISIEDFNLDLQLEKTNNIYQFHLGNAENNVYTTCSEINFTLKNNKIDDYDIDLTECCVLKLENNILQPVDEGSGVIVVAYMDYKFEIYVNVSKVYVSAEDIEIVYSNLVYLSESTEINVVVNNLDCDKYLYEDVCLNVSGLEVIVDGLRICLLGNESGILSCSLVKGDIEKKFSIKVLSDKVDDVKLKYESCYLEKLDLTTYEFVELEYYSDGNKISINKNYDVNILSSDENIFIISNNNINNIIYLYPKSKGEAVLYVYIEDVLIKEFIIAVQ